MVESEVLALLRHRVGGNTVSGTAVDLGVSQQVLWFVLKGQRKPGAQLLRTLGLRKVISYEPLQTQQALVRSVRSVRSTRRRSK